MNDVLENQEFDAPQKRPVFLMVLCILTFIYTGFSILTNIFSLVKGPASEEEILTLKVEFTRQMNEMSDLGVTWAANLFRNLMHITEATNNNHYLMVLSSIVIVTLGLIGAIWMFKGKKMGFHFYIIYSLLTVVQLYFFVDASYIPTILVVTNLIISAIFIFMYSRNLKWMK